MDVEQIAFTIIAHAGEAKSLAFEALSKAKQGCFNKADDLIEQSQKEVNLAHKGQMDLLVAEANGEKTDISVLLIHSQDHLMTCMLAIDLIKEMIEMRNLSDQLHRADFFLPFLLHTQSMNGPVHLLEYAVPQIRRHLSQHHCVCVPVCNQPQQNFQ